MYKPQLKTFVCAAQTGSFSKAAKMQSISAAAVLKQINMLEEEWKVTLFWRTHTGLLLTPEGRQLLQDAKYIMEYADSALSRVHGCQKGLQPLRIGVSRLTSTPFLPQLLPPIRRRCPDLQLQMVTFENKPEISRSMLQNFGQDIDLIIAMCDPIKKGNRTQLPLFWEPVCCAMSVSHPLAGKERLSIEDLFGQSLMIVAKNRNSFIDRIRADLERNYPQIHLLDFTYVDINAFNACAQSQNLMIAIGRWSSVHPLLHIAPVNWPYQLPFGLQYALHPSAAVQEFAAAARELFPKGVDIHV